MVFFEEGAGASSSKRIMYKHECISKRTVAASEIEEEIAVP